MNSRPCTTKKAAGIHMLALSLALVLSQWVLLVHATEHALSAPHDTCVTCEMAQAPAMPSTVVLPVPAGLIEAPAPLQAVLASPVYPTPHSARGPPV